MVNKRRQTLATGLAKPTDGSTASSSTTRTKGPRIPKSRKSMIPRVAGQENEVNGTSSAAAAAAAANASSKMRGASPSRLPRKSMGGVPSRKSMGSSMSNHNHRNNNNAPSNNNNGISTPSKNRRVSLAPSNEHGYVPQDPRTKDKPYLLSAIKKMISYLKRHGYDTSNFNPHKLVSHGVSGRDFNGIMTFLIRRLDPTFNTSSSNNTRTDEPVMKFEEEVSLAFRTLGYPLPISKTGIVAVGAPHTWPALIAAIDWLVDMLCMVEAESPFDWMDDMDNTEELYSMESNVERATRQFDAFLRAAFVAFLNGEEERQQELEAELLEKFEMENQTLCAYMEEVEGELQALLGEVEVLERENEGLSEFDQKREEYAKDIEKYLSLVSQMKEYQSELQTKVNSLTEEKAAMESSMDETSANIDRLKSIIGSQELTVDDVRKMERQKIRLEEQCAQKKTVLEGHVNALKETEQKYTQCMELLNTAVEEYNSKARGLELIPEKAKNANGEKIEIQLSEKKGESLEGLLGLDIDSVVAHLKKVADGYAKETKEQKMQMNDLKERLIILEAESDELEQEIDAIKDKIAALQEEFTTEQEMLQSEIQGKQSQLQILQSKITTLNDPGETESAISKYEKQYKELLVAQKQQDKENVARKKAVSDEIRKIIEVSVDHSKFVQKTIDERNAYAKKKKEGLKLNLPTEEKSH